MKIYIAEVNEAPGDTSCNQCMSQINLCVLFLPDMSCFSCAILTVALDQQYFSAHIVVGYCWNITTDWSDCLI